MKKIRADAVENRLNAAAREELQKLVTANAPLKELQAFFEKQGVEVSLPGAARAHHRLAAAADRLMHRAATLKALRDLAEKQGITLTGAALEQATVAVGDLLDASVDPASEEGQQLLLKGLTALTGARSVEVSAERVGQQGAALKLATDKFQFDATKAALAKLPELRKIAADKSLTDTARIDAARRQLFGEVAA